jgi:hypothetical protein
MRMDDPHGGGRPITAVATSPPFTSPSPTDRLAAWLLGGPLSAALLALAAVQVAAWLPHYLNWPYWADHDTFATVARAWVDGDRPYRDTVGNNFPGTIYLFLLLGKVVGWGRPWGLFAFDAGLLLTFGAVLVAWSRRCFGNALAGAAGVVVFQSYYLSLDVCHAAQRDWHGPVAAVLGILVVQGWPGRGTRVFAGLAAAAALSVRPQTVLLWPALWAAVGDSAGVDRRRAFLEWLGALAAGLALAFAPIVLAGVFGDFVRGVRLTAYGGGYNRVTAGSFVKSWALQASDWRWWGLAGGLCWLGAPFRTGAGRAARPWLWALAGVSLYKSLSPVAHSYLDIPLELVGAVGVAALVGLIGGSRRAAGPAFRLAAVALAVGLGPTTLRPEFCVAGPTARAAAALVRGRLPDGTQTPPGYRRGSVPTSAYYPWRDYRAALDYLRATTRPSTRVANVLKGDPAVCAMVDRRSAFPAESVAWLRMVRPEDEARFADALDEARDAVVVWVPGEVGPDPDFHVGRIERVIRRRFAFEARFGAIEVWGRRAER